MKLKFFVLPAAAVTAASLLIAPESSEGYVLLGGALSQNQRDVRVFDNFTDNSANNNTTADPDWPGYTGAELAIWKACVEWSSEPHNGTGAGDPTQSAIGNGGANFDPSWQGNATGVGTSNSNVHSELSGNGGGVLAFMEGPISDGWRIRYYSNWTWHDGPGSIGNGIDLQGVATHEYGHALGLDHTTVSGSTMLASIIGNGVATRSIQSDDIAGVQAVYGVADTNIKPRINGTNLSSGTLTVFGNNFAANNNEVWFTQAGQGGNGTPVKATGLSSIGGSQIVTALPAGIGPGDILVKNGGNASFTGLSNPYAFDPNAGPNPPATEVNIDLGIGQGTPGTGQGGAAGNVGGWNGVSLPTTATSLFNPAQLQTAGVFSHSGTQGEVVFDDPSTSGLWEKLFDDGHDVGCTPGSTVTYVFDGFSPGTYDVYVYSWVFEDPTNSFTDITVMGGLKGAQAVGGIAFQTNFVEGGNFVRDQVTIAAGGAIRVVASQNQGCARVNGFQILPGTACGVPVNYCTAGTSASGCQATLSAVGTPSATAPSGFTLQASGVEGGKDGLFFYGTNGQQANSWGSGTSFQCVVPPVFRAGLINGVGTSGACDGSFSQDLNALWTSNPAKNPGVGANVNAQLWYRDPQNTSNQTTSLSDGLNFVLCP